ncbi:MAG TPA: hypothetical protein VK660_10600 [Xanthomonadaceae bacterium]|nr:hypothetical protein [Xanthomonadaceae bacterium]
MLGHVAGQAEYVPHVAKSRKNAGPRISPQYKIDFRFGEAPLKLKDQGRQQQGVAKPMVWPAHDNALNVDPCQLTIASDTGFDRPIDATKQPRHQATAQGIVFPAVEQRPKFCHFEFHNL